MGLVLPFLITRQKVGQYTKWAKGVAHHQLLSMLCFQILVYQIL